MTYINYENTFILRHWYSVLGFICKLENQTDTPALFCNKNEEKKL
ncbi:4356_t:CDS:2 [Gigaspora margarita]|uniref:4356_t:CDS:1 n=1 Tax=Gigaspora margarita TaxID=4874 RepID=A0ABN7UGD2_GIGMA|nr:4356_t:CDS:2 [Gigaspora margarita]